jgi:ribosomal protein L23
VSVDERDRVTEKTVLLLKSIKTLEDLKKNKEEILDLMEEIFESAVQALNIFFDESLSMSSDEKQKEAMKFQDENYLIKDLLGKVK